MRLNLTLFSLKVHHKILARPKPVRPISTTNQRRLVVVVGYGGGFGHVGAFFGAGVVCVSHSLQSPVHSMDFSKTGASKKLSCLFSLKLE